MNLNRMFAGVGLGFVILLSGCGGIPRLNEIDSDPSTGFALYRSGQPKADDAKELCAMGITKVFALNAGAEEYTVKMKTICNVEVAFNDMQDPDKPVSAEFLAKFDAAVADAKINGGKILFHCTCGCHRTGRLAAYYRMKYQNWSSESAIDEMNDIGKDMDQHPTLEPQIRSLFEHIHGKSCSQPSQSCFTPLAETVAMTLINDERIGRRLRIQ